MKIKIIIILSLLMPIIVMAQESSNIAAVMRLYEEGDISAARDKIDSEISDARQNKNDYKLWNALMVRAWLEDEVSNHRLAIDFSNQALEVANKMNNDFAIGRTLTWLGWAYSHLGLYDLAKSFYQNALEVGAPKGNVKYLNVWGLALQEMGALKVKMGNLEEGKIDLEKAYKAATEAKVEAGIAESGTHLSAVAFLQGDLTKAYEYANVAFLAAERCKCSPYNLYNAKLQRIKVSIAEKVKSLEETKKIQVDIEDIINQCQKMQIVSCQAESKILLSKTVPQENFEQRFNLIRSAFEELSNAEIENKGQAEAELGRLYLDQNNVTMAEFYLKNGLQVSKELFRKIDEAYITTDLSKADSAQQKEAEAIEKLLEAARLAKNSQAYSLAYKNEKELVLKYKNLTYYSLALKWQGEALKSLDFIYSQNENKKNDYEAEKIYLFEVGAELRLLLQQNVHQPG